MFGAWSASTGKPTRTRRCYGRRPPSHRGAVGALTLIAGCLLAMTPGACGSPRLPTASCGRVLERGGSLVPGEAGTNAVLECFDRAVTACNPASIEVIDAGIDTVGYNVVSVSKDAGLSCTASDQSWSYCANFGGHTSGVDSRSCSAPVVTSDMVTITCGADSFVLPSEASQGAAMEDPGTDAVGQYGLTWEARRSETAASVAP